jgi:phosphatidylserine/phosphatidylglycerophosphate/cardiolipin synthase-like enzyme
MSKLGDAVLAIADRLPSSDVEALARAVAGGADGLESLRSATGSPVLRAACGKLLVLLGEHPAERLAGVLDGIAVAAGHERERQQIEVVWTGPDSGVGSGRLTATVVAELINAAAKEILLVSFAGHPDAQILAALAAAVSRGVQLTLLAERFADNPSFRGGEDWSAELTATRLCWPSSERPHGAALHVKALVIDTAMALVGSANFTGPGMKRNLECAILIRGGPHPAAIRDHVWSLYRHGTLQRT